MTRVARHSVDLERAQEGAESKLSVMEHSLSLPVARPSMLGGAILSGVSYAGYLAVVSPESPQLCRALRVATAAGISLFALASGSGDTKVTLGEGTEWTLPASGPNDTAHVGSWQTTYQLATLTGNRAAVEKLCAVPLAVLRGSSSVGDECSYLYVSAIQAYERRAPDAEEILLAAIEATDPKSNELADEEYVLDLLVPEMQLLFRVMTGDVQAFNDALELALKQHVRYWKKGDRKLDPAGYLALGPAAFARIARAASMPIRVESDLIPLRLIEGACESAG